MSEQPHMTHWKFTASILFLGALALIAISFMLRESNSNLEQRLIDSANQLRESKDQVKKNEDLILTLTDRLKSAQELANDLRQTIERSYAKLEETKDKFIRQLAAAEMKNSDLQLEISKLQLQITSLGEEIADLKERIEGYQTEIADLKKQVAQQQTQIASLEGLLEKRRREPFKNSVDIWMVPINDGAYQMGSPPGAPGAEPDEKIHAVQLTRPFYMSAYEVTQQQYSMVIKARPPWEDEEFVKNGPNYPASWVTYDHAVEFCRILTEHHAIPGATYRLPTEAEWEYACRAGAKAAPGGNNAWLGPNDQSPHPVGQKQPNLWGLYDMHGNVDEWCQDWYGPYDPKAVVNPTGPENGMDRVVRGGTVNLPPIVARSSNREFGDPMDSRSSRGFRVIRTYTAP
jgi:sulfatase modifying factor 1